MGTIQISYIHTEYGNLKWEKYFSWRKIISFVNYSVPIIRGRDKVKNEGWEGRERRALKIYFWLFKNQQTWILSVHEADNG